MNVYFSYWTNEKEKLRSKCHLISIGKGWFVINSPPIIIIVACGKVAPIAIPFIINKWIVYINKSEYDIEIGTIKDKTDVEMDCFIILNICNIKYWKHYYVDHEWKHVYGDII